MTCGPTSNGAPEADGSWPVIGIDVQTVDATPQLLRVAGLIVDSGCKAVVSVLGVQVPVGSTFGYDFWGLASRAGAGSGAGQYGDITNGIPAGWATPLIVVSGTHVVSITWAGLAATVVNWSIRAHMQWVGGATP